MCFCLSSEIINEERINKSDICRMSALSHTILKNAPYQFIRDKRVKNYEIASNLYRDLNRIDPSIYFDDTCVPYVYPLLVERADMVDLLNKERFYTGTLVELFIKGNKFIFF